MSPCTSYVGFLFCLQRYKVEMIYAIAANDNADCLQLSFRPSGASGEICGKGAIVFQKESDVETVK